MLVTFGRWGLCVCSEWIDLDFLPLHLIGEHPGSPLALKLMQALTLLTEEG